MSIGLLKFKQSVCFQFKMCIMHLTVFSDRIRTSVNVLGDSVGAGVVGCLSRKDLGIKEISEFNFDESNSSYEIREENHSTKKGFINAAAETVLDSTTF